MKIFKLNIIAIVLAAFMLAACSKEKQKRSIDFGDFKKEVKLSADQEKSFDAITTKYQELQKQNFEAAKAQGGKMDRVALGIKNEELRTQQAEEMSKVLDTRQMEQFNKFVDEHSRKRPRYDNALLEKIKTEAGLTDEEFAIVNAANDAFERSFNDAHDVYHGNNDLAKEYWTKFNGQRKEAIKQALPAGKYEKYLNIVKDVQFKARK
ncbi:hypothetical protein [Daejeonia sp. YH14]|uniref:hypothetical protein n=1 Tax=Daejeonia sp. YH14 TaxID=3439042 RepID=UPI003F4968B2